MRAILIILGFGILALLLGFTVALLIQKYRVNRRWKQEQEEFSSSGTLPKTRNHSEISSEGFAIILTAIVTFLVTMFIFRYFIADLHDQIVLSERNIKEEYRELENMVSDLLIGQKRSASSLASLRVVADEGAFDPQTDTAVLRLEIIPKESGENTRISVRIDDRDYDAEKNGTIYTVLYKKNIFEELWSDPEITVTVSDNGVIRTETIDSEVYPEIEPILYDCHSLFLPTCGGSSFMAAAEVTNKNGTTAVSYEKIRTDIIKPRVGTVSLESCSFLLSVDGKTVYEKDITSLMISDNRGVKCWTAADISLEASFPAEKNDRIDMFLRFTDTLGYTTTEYFGSLDGETGPCPWTTITNAVGDTVFEQ